MATENPFVKLFAIDFKDHLEVKKSGNTELKYVSWAYAWAEVKKLYPSASYEVKKFNGLPYVYDPITGFMVYTTVTIEGVSHEMWLPVLDGTNKAMKAVPYTYTTPKWDYVHHSIKHYFQAIENPHGTSSMWAFSCYHPTDFR